MRSRAFLIRTIFTSVGVFSRPPKMLERECENAEGIIFKVDKNESWTFRETKSDILSVKHELPFVRW